MERMKKGHPRGRPFPFNTKNSIYGLVYTYLSNNRIAGIG